MESATAIATATAPAKPPAAAPAKADTASAATRAAWPRRLRNGAVTIAVLVAVYALLGFLVLPLLAKPRIETALSDEFDRRATIGRLEFNPFTLHARLADFALADREPGDSLGDFAGAQVADARPGAGHGVGQRPRAAVAQQILNADVPQLITAIGQESRQHRHAHAPRQIPHGGELARDPCRLQAALQVFGAQRAHDRAHYGDVFGGRQHLRALRHVRRARGGRHLP